MGRLRCWGGCKGRGVCGQGLVQGLALELVLVLVLVVNQGRRSGRG